MKIVGQFNKVSDSLKKKIKPLTRNEQANYRLLTGYHDAVSGETRYGSHQTIVCRDTIYDEQQGQLITIGVPRIIREGEVVKVKKYEVRSVGKNMLTNGVFTLQGGNLEHQEFYEFFELSNFNKSNADRDTGIMPIFERIDEVGEAEAENLVFDTLTKALVAADQMDKEGVKTFASIMNWDTKLHPTILKNRIKKYAREEPKLFLEKQDDPENKTKVIIKQALDAGIVSYQPAEHKMLWGKDGTTLARLEKAQDGESEIDSFFQWIQQSKNGENILKSINNALKNQSKSGE